MRSCAIVVGINIYPPQSGVTTLYGAVADAADFADWALDPNGGDVGDRLYFWTFPAPAAPSPRLLAYLSNPTAWADNTPPDPTRGPTEREIKRTAHQLMTTMPGAGVQRIYVFFAGHGVQTASLDIGRDPQTCFVVSDFMPGPTDGLIPCDDLRRGLTATGRFSEAIMFLDCCRTKMTLNAAPPALGFPIAALQDTPYGVGRAAKRGAKAFEAPEPNPTRGAFSQVLVEGLRRQRNANNELTLNDLETYVSAGVENILGQGKQYPQFEIEPRNPPYRLLTGAPIQPNIPIVIRFNTLPPGIPLQLTGPDGSVVQGLFVSGMNALTINAPAGTLYSLETPDHTFIKTFKHDGPGATHVDA